MKHLIILGDGMADEPLDVLDGKTPLQYASTPNLDQLAKMGVSGYLKTVEDGFHPGSEVANMSVLGYDLPSVYEGRGVLEAASIGVDLHPGEIAMRCNLVCIEGDILKNHSAGHISTEEADELIKTLNEELGSDMVHFYTGVSYRHLLVIKSGSKELDCTPPHDVPLQPYRPLMIKPRNHSAEKTADMLNELIFRSMEVLENHPVNLKRAAQGKDKANCIWPWSPGERPAMKTLNQLYGIGKSSVISAVDLIRGIGVYAGMKVIMVEGATGLYDTNYEGKVAAALDALKTDDFVYLHIEASDEAGHEGDVNLKIKTIENLDGRVVGPVMKALSSFGEDVAVAVLPDHPTPCAVRTHTSKPVPFVFYKPGETPDAVEVYDEFSVVEGKYGILEKDQFIKEFLK